MMHLFKMCEVYIYFYKSSIEQHILDTNAGKQLLSCHRCLINTGVEKNEQLLNKYYNFDHEMSLSKSKCLHPNNYLHFESILFH